jgi:hypothetical protein
LFQIARSGAVTFLQSRNFLSFKFLTHAFCTRLGGVSEGKFASLNMAVNQGDEEEKIRENWRILSRTFNIQEKSFRIMNQIHGDDVLVIGEEGAMASEGQVPACDACVTQCPEVALCIKTADCVPVFLLDPHRKVIGAVHAGWTGTALKVAAKVVDVMVQEFQCRPEDIQAAVGPSIGPCCYEVDSRVYLAMCDHYGSENFFRSSHRPGRWNLDLPRANCSQLLEKGLVKENIELSGHCTFCLSDLFFSHRRDKGETGRHVNFIMLKHEI